MVYHIQPLKKAESQASESIHISIAKFAKLLNTLKELCHGKLCLQVTMSHEHPHPQFYKNHPLNRTLIHGVYVNLDCWITHISQNARQTKYGQLQ